MATLRSSQGDDELVEDQGVVTRFFRLVQMTPNTPKVELLEPTAQVTPIGKFLDKRGPGIQQICFRIENIQEMISVFLENGIKMIDEIPREGAHGAKIAFVHPKSTGGVLVELAENNTTTKQ